MRNLLRSGVLVLDGEGEARFSSGLATDLVIQTELSRLWRTHMGKPLPTLFSLTSLDRLLTVLTYPAFGASCFLLHEHATADPLYEFVSSVDFAADILRYFVTNPYEAVTVVDKHANICYMSPVHERFFDMPLAAVIGRPANEVIENTRLHTVLKTQKAEVGDIQTMRGTKRVVSRTPIFDSDGDMVGAIGQVMFKSPSALQAMSHEIERLRQEIDFYKRELPRLHGEFEGLEAIVGESDATVRLKEQIIKVAPLDVPVLLVGESGVGKDLVAHAIHALSRRATKPLVVINAAALPTNLVEAELFGYEGGAFTGAERKGRSGKFEQADQGTLFLDEIGDMPLEVQVKLLRTLQDGGFQPIGGAGTKSSDFRLVSASNRDFKHMLSAGEFRLDLFYRISAVTIRLPALRERKDDIPLLANKFLNDFIKRHAMPPKVIDPGVFEFLKSLPWPGNVRQLQHVIERAAIFSSSDTIAVHDCEVPLDLNDSLVSVTNDQPLSRQSPSVKLRSAKALIEHELISETMRKFDGNKKKTAEHLGISRSHLYKKLSEIETKSQG